MATRSNKTLSSRLAGGLMGLLIGDALGVPYEFKPARALPALEQIDMIPPKGFPRAHSGVPPGTWSDDGSQALCLLESLLECGRLDIEDFAARLVRWRHDGHLTVDGKVFDCGIQTNTALARLRNGVTAHESGPADEGDNGNGALMRVLPLALWHQGTDAELVEDAHAQCLPTHGHRRSQVCCARYCLVARAMLDDHNAPWVEASSALAVHYRELPEYWTELDLVLRAEQRAKPRGSGYVVDTLWSAARALEQPDYASVIRAAIAFGNDTDTTACVAGGLAGIRYGLEGLPAAWTAALRGRDLLDPLAEGLLATGLRSAHATNQ